MGGSDYRSQKKLKQPNSDIKQIMCKGLWMQVKALGGDRFCWDDDSNVDDSDDDYSNNNNSNVIMSG